MKSHAAKKAVPGSDVPGERTMTIRPQLAICFPAIFLLVFSLAAKEYRNEKTSRALFIGNSFSGYHDMPGMVEKLARAAGKNLGVDRVIMYGNSLVSTAEMACTRKKIGQEKWDFLVLQDGIHNAAYPETHHLIVPPYRYQPLLGPLEKLSRLARLNSRETRVIYFMPWAFKDGITWIKGQTDTYETMQEKIAFNSRALAKKLDLMVAPVGWAWLSVIREKPQIELFSPDWSHPSQKGAYLAACVFVVTFFSQDITGTPYYGGLDKDEATYLQGVASTVVLKNPETWNIPPN